jgi:hypothetical protein
MGRRQSQALDNEKANEFFVSADKLSVNADFR